MAVDIGAAATSPGMSSVRSTWQLVDTLGRRMPDLSGELALLRHDGELRAAVDPAERLLAERAVITPWIGLADGPWKAPTGLQPQGPAILIEGLLIQEVNLVDRTSAYLLGPGAILHDLGGDDASLPCEMSWTSLGESRIALLDHRFEVAARRWPGLWQVVHQRYGEQLKTAARWSCSISLPRVEQRVLAVFWLIADRWGVMRPDGIAIRLPLTHETIGRMVAARRPTVSLALAGLTEAGLLTATDRDEWLLAPGSRDTLAPQRTDENGQGVGLEDWELAGATPGPEHTRTSL